MHLQYTNDKKRNKSDNENKITKDVAGAGPMWCFLQGWAEFDVTPLIEIGRHLLAKVV